MTAGVFYSIRMHATHREKHLSGGERIVPEDRMDVIVCSLLARAREKQLPPDAIRITIEALTAVELSPLPGLPLIATDIAEVTAARHLAGTVLLHAGVSSDAIIRAMALIAGGAGPEGANMRGALLIDAQTGDRLEPDQARGVRATRFDWSDDAGSAAERALGGIGLTHFRTREALALATKIAHGPSVVAELCWSDDPDYTAGYVSARSMGYVRFPFLKEAGDPHGGRAIFVRDRAYIDDLITYLEKRPVMISSMGSCSDKKALIADGMIRSTACSDPN